VTSVGDAALSWQSQSPALTASGQIRRDLAFGKKAPQIEFGRRRPNPTRPSRQIQRAKVLSLDRRYGPLIGNGYPPRQLGAPAKEARTQPSLPSRLEPRKQLPPDLGGGTGSRQWKRARKIPQAKAVASNVTFVPNAGFQEDRVVRETFPSLD
jgi:hypothetical protein